MFYGEGVELFDKSGKALAPGARVVFREVERNGGCFAQMAAVALFRWQDAVYFQAFKNQGIAPFRALIAADLPQRGVAGDVFIGGDDVPVVSLKGAHEVVEVALHRRGYDESGRSRSSFTYRVSACAYVANCQIKCNTSSKCTS